MQTSLKSSKPSEMLVFKRTANIINQMYDGKFDVAENKYWKTWNKNMQNHCI